MRKRIALVGLAISLAGATSVSAQERVNPYWAEAADPYVAAQLFPGFAALLETPGWARVECWVEADGHPFVCQIVGESPRGLGFGSAARVIIASARVGVSRIDGRPVPTTISTNVRFRPPEVRSAWDGPEPSTSQLALALELVSSMPEAFPTNYRDMMMDGLDFDRREVVGPWIDELLPMDREEALRIQALQIARLFSEDDLRRIRAGEPVEAPSPEAFQAACPEPTPREVAAIAELRRRYCSRYDCEVADVGIAIP